MSGDRFTLRTRLLLTVLLPVLLLSVAMTGFSLFRGARMADREIAERGLAIVSFLAPAAEYSVISGSRGSLDGLMLALQAQSDVAAAVLYDGRGEELARLGDPLLNEGGGTFAPREAARLRRHGKRAAFAAPVLSVPVAVDEFAGGKLDLDPLRVGWVYVELDTGAYDARWRATVMTTIGLAAAAVALAMLLAIHLANVVGAPVARLVEAVRRMARGELDVQVTGRAGSEELQALEDGFNSMARSIANAHKTLQARIEQATARLAYQALHDPLTSLPNRRAFEQALEELLSASRRAGDHGALCFMDLDHFKPVNDTGGHAAGDALLRVVADLIRSHLRSEDTVCRIGGDEFALILRGCTPADAARIANGLCEAVGELRFEWEGREYRIGASIGFAMIDGALGSVAEIVRAADHACYTVKREGRGRAMAYRADDVGAAPPGG
jgi:diguanylate cyclase (GGDEF)-like protein